MNVMQRDYDAYTADEDLHHHLAHHVGEYLSSAEHDAEFAAVLYSTTFAEMQGRAFGEYPPEGRGYPSTR
ncbi:hypothetical protein AB0A70_06480 [Streptomyces morookaense]|uniref:hypothetical protein n=1 Tax=Streptomyces morookaense TaxID=1970 RepID=UPI0033E8DFE1